MVQNICLIDYLRNIDERKMPENINEDISFVKDLRPFCVQLTFLEFCAWAILLDPFDVGNAGGIWDIASLAIDSVRNV